MSYQDQLYEFLEDELPVEQETGLFAELASNAELRTEMKDVLSMQRAVGADTRAFAVPAASVQGVFSSLGYMAPAAAGAGAASGMLALLKSGYGVAAAGLMGALVTTATFFGLGGTLSSSETIPSGKETPASAIAEFSPVDIEMTLPAPEPAPRALSSSSAIAAETLVSRSEALSSSVVAGTKVAASSFTATERLTTSRNVLTPSDLSFDLDVVQPMESLNSVVDQVQIGDGQRNTSVPMYALPESLFASPSYFVFELRQMTTWSLDNPDVSPQANAGPANFAISLGIPTAEESRVVLDFGRESFYMNFTQHLDNGGSVVHRKNPLMWWGGVGYRHLFNVHGTVQPFVQGIVGAAETGPMGRLMLGTEVSLSTSIRLFGAVEGSSLFYSLDGNDYWSSNLGLVYGLTLNF